MGKNAQEDLRAMEADNIIEGSWRSLRYFGCHHLEDLRWQVGEVYSPGPWVVHTEYD
jgi:hypothetical protein